MNPTVATLDDKGRCCGRKPIAYKRPPKLFCVCCDREFDPTTGIQRPNFHWAWNGDRLVYSRTAALAEANMAPTWGERV